MIADYAVVRVCCTDGGRHRAHHFDTARVWPGQPGRYQFDGPLGTFLGSGPEGRKWSYHTLDCPRCPRHTELTNDKLWTVLAGLAIHGVDRLDISRLPF